MIKTEYMIMEEGLDIDALWIAQVEKDTEMLIEFVEENYFELHPKTVNMIDTVLRGEDYDFENHNLWG